MGKHGNKDNGKVEKPDDGYQPKHSGGQDGFEWAKGAVGSLPTYQPETPASEYTKDVAQNPKPEE